MKKSIVLVLALMFFLTSCATGMKESNAKIYTVKQDGSGDFTTIQEAVDVVQPGEIVEIYGGIYRESVVIPRGGLDEDNRIWIRAHENDEVIITGSDGVLSDLWDKDEKTGLWKLTLDNTFFGEYNPFAEKWQGKIASIPNVNGEKTSPCCGGIYLDGESLTFAANLDTVKVTAETYFAEVNETNTVIWVNTAKDVKNAETEVSNRRQLLTASWNQGFITITGITVERGAAPKTSGFAQMGSKSMAGALSTNGGYNWIIENCEVRYNRGVAIDFGLGSRGFMYDNCGPVTEDNPDPSPEYYGHHIIRNNYVHHNATNGIMAYRGAYTELYGNVLYNNDEFHTGLASEAYIKNVNSGYGINIHDNYFYSDHDWSTLAIWYDTEADGSAITNNVFFSNGKNGSGLSGLEFETIAGWVTCSGNIFINCGYNILNCSDISIFNNLFLNAKSEFPGHPTPMKAFGWNGYSRAMRAKYPGTLETICIDGTDGNSAFEVYHRFNKLKNNIFFANGVTSSEKSDECSTEEYNGKYYEWLNKVDATTDRTNAEKDARLQADNWTAVDPNYQKDGSFSYGNECDWNAYLSGADKINYQYGTKRGYYADENSVVLEGGSYSVEGDENGMTLNLVLDAGIREFKAPSITSEGLSNPALYSYLGVDFPVEVVTTDMFGIERTDVSVGPFASLDDGFYTKTIKFAEINVVISSI